MAHRRFTDRTGRSWDVWTVVPTNVERRSVAVPESGEDRRQKEEFRANLGPELSGGWLCFETKGEKRRLAPYPEHWEELPDLELEMLLSRAKRSRPQRKSVET
jgi:hypothetical protein